MKTKSIVSIAWIGLCASFAILSFGMCTAGTYQLPSPIPADMNECNRLDLYAEYYESTPDGFSYGPNSACKPGRLSCQLFNQDDNKNSYYRWVKISPPRVESTTEKCNKIDDDCNGLIDDVADAGLVCISGKGACRRIGFLGCNPDFQCIPKTSNDMDISTDWHLSYAPVPHVPNDVTDYSWDWNCDGKIEATAFPISGSVIASSIKTDGTTGSYTQSTYPQVEPAPLSIPCKGICTAGSAGVYQWLSVFDKDIAKDLIPNQPVPKPELTCGKIFRVAKCQFNAAMMECQVAEILNWGVYCR